MPRECGKPISPRTSILFADADAPHRADEVAEAVDGEHRRVVERRDEERRGRDARGDARRDAASASATSSLNACVELVLDAARSSTRFASRLRIAPSDGRLARMNFARCNSRAFGSRLTAMWSTSLRSTPRFVEAVADGDRRKSRPVLDAPEALLLGRGDELAVDDDAGRGVGVMGVDAEDDHR